MSHETKESISLVLYHDSPTRNMMRTNEPVSADDYDTGLIEEYWSKTTRGRELLPNGKKCLVCDDKADSRCSLCDFSVCKNCHSYTPLREEVEMHLLDGHQELLKILPPELGRIVVKYLEGSPSSPITYHPTVTWYDPIVNRMTGPMALTLCINLFVYVISFGFGIGLAGCIPSAGRRLVAFLIIYGIMGCIYFAILIRGSVLQGPKFKRFLASIGVFIVFLLGWVACGSIWAVLHNQNSAPVSKCESIATQVTMAVCVVSWIWAVCVISLFAGYLCELAQKRQYR